LAKYRIQSVAQMTGLSPAVIRAWEARYGLVVPERSESGYRLYSEEDVVALQAAQRLVAQGMAPMEVAALPRQEVLRRASAPPPLMPAPPPAPLTEVIAPLLSAIAAFDRERTEQLLARPLVMLPAEALCGQLLAPLLHELGDRWQRGELPLAAGHFAAAVIRTKLFALIDLEHRLVQRRAGARRRVLCACPPGERHDLGLLMFALHACERGWDAIWLGADVPLPDLHQIAAALRPDLVALSLVQRGETAALLRLFREARSAVPEPVPLLWGGRAISGREPLVFETGGLLWPRSGNLEELLQNRAPVRDGV
jgi:DNA-binding transcriptional MerR regulator/methylmalonyl-CoA mutase cobalamin-binding subunit